MLSTHRLHPAAALVDPFRAMDLLFDAMLSPQKRAGRRASTKLAQGVPNTAQFQVEDKGEAFELRAYLPGLAPEALSLEVGDDWLTLGATRSLTIPEGYEARLSERRSYDFERRIQLRGRIDSARVEARLRDGVLTITAPKLAAAEPRRVAINAA